MPAAPRKRGEDDVDRQYDGAGYDVRVVKHGVARFAAANARSSENLILRAYEIHVSGTRLRKWPDDSATVSDEAAIESTPAAPSKRKRTKRRR
jgi:hypothetical protein